ncbi:MAG: YdjY domain-containing protein [Limisphaerales bacterium]
MLQLLCSIFLILPGVSLFHFADAAEVSTNTPIQDLGEGRLKIGLVTVDSKLKSLTFPAVVNMTTGMVEYVIVTTTGKVHESLLRTDAEPIHIHTAMLLLDLKQSDDSASESAAFFDAKKQIPGRALKIEVTIPGPAARTSPVHTFLAFASSKAPVKASDLPTWIYNGSRFATSPLTDTPPSGTPTNGARTFLAQREGSIVSLIADPAALVNNPRPDRENDELWTLHTPAIPAVGTLVQVKFELE